MDLCIASVEDFNATALTLSMPSAVNAAPAPKAVYVRETASTSRKRFTGHRSDIRHEHNYKPVAEHFNSPGHNINDLRIIVLRKLISNNLLDRRIEEQRTIHFYICINDRDAGFMGLHK